MSLHGWKKDKRGYYVKGIRHIRYKFERADQVYYSSYISQLKISPSKKLHIVSGYDEGAHHMNLLHNKRFKSRSEALKYLKEYLEKN